MPPKRSTPKILHRAGELRTLALGASAREEPTPAEGKLWSYLRDAKLNKVFRITRLKVIRFWNDDVMNNFEGVILGDIG